MSSSQYYILLLVIFLFLFNLLGMEPPLYSGASPGEAKGQAGEGAAQ